MRLSEAFGIGRSDADGWFDPNLHIGTSSLIDRPLCRLNATRLERLADLLRARIKMAPTYAPWSHGNALVRVERKRGEHEC